MEKLFNMRLDSNTGRVIDFNEGASVGEAALQALIVESVELNTSKGH